MFPSHRLTLHGYLYYGEQGFTGLPVKYKQVARLGCLGHGGNGFTTALQGNQVGRCGQVPVPHIVVDRLKVPEPLAGAHVQCDDAVSEEVVARSEASEVVDRRRIRR